jgi:hypothetical protein
MKYEIDARRGYRPRHKSRYIGHTQSSCNSRGLACGPMRFTTGTKTGHAPDHYGQERHPRCSVVPGNSTDRLVDDEVNSRRTSRQAAYRDRPCAGLLQRGVATPGQIDYARGISGLRMVKERGAVERLGIVGARQELCAHRNVPTCACDRSFWSVTVNDVLITNQDCH